jgi:hypothetical protein
VAWIDIRRPFRCSKARLATHFCRRPFASNVRESACQIRMRTFEADHEPFALPKSSAISSSQSLLPVGRSQIRSSPCSELGNRQLAPARLFRRPIGTRRSQPASEFAYPCVLGEPFMASVADWAEHPAKEHRRGLKIRSFSLQPGRDCAPRGRTSHHDDTHQFLRCVRKDAHHYFAGGPVRPSGGAQSSTTVVSRDTHVQRRRKHRHAQSPQRARPQSPPLHQKRSRRRCVPRW